MALDIQTLLSGLSEAEARKKVAAEDMAMAKGLASRPGHAGFMGLLMQGSRGLSEAMGYVDPEIDSAIKLEVLKKKVADRASAMGVDEKSDPEKFYDIFTATAIEDGNLPFAQAALEAKERAKSERLKRDIAERQMKDIETDTVNKKAYDDEMLKLKKRELELLNELKQLRETKTTQPKAPLRATREDKKTAIAELQARPELVTGLKDEELIALGSALATKMNERRNIMKDEFDYELEFDNALQELQTSGKLVPGKVRKFLGIDRLAPDKSAEYKPGSSNGSKTIGGTSLTETNDKVKVINPNGISGYIPRSQLDEALKQGYKEAK